MKKFLEQNSPIILKKVFHLNCKLGSRRAFLLESGQKYIYLYQLKVRDELCLGVWEFP